MGVLWASIAPVPEIGISPFFSSISLSRKFYCPQWYMNRLMSPDGWVNWRNGVRNLPCASSGLVVVVEKLSWNWLLRNDLLWNLHDARRVAQAAKI